MTEKVLQESIVGKSSLKAESIVQTSQQEPIKAI